MPGPGRATTRRLVAAHSGEELDDDVTGVAQVVRDALRENDQDEQNPW